MEGFDMSPAGWALLAAIIFIVAGVFLPRERASAAGLCIFAASGMTVLALFAWMAE